MIYREKNDACIVHTSLHIYIYAISSYVQQDANNPSGVLGSCWCFVEDPVVRR